MTEIRLSQEFSSEFDILKTRRDKGDGEAEYLLNLIDKGISRLRDNHKTGQKIQKRLWPRYYSQRYGISNLWRLRLDDYWRMIYTLIGRKVEITAVVLDVIDHKEYDKRFGYK